MLHSHIQVVTLEETDVAKLKNGKPLSMALSNGNSIELRFAVNGNGHVNGSKHSVTGLVLKVLNGGSKSFNEICNALQGKVKANNVRVALYNLAHQKRIKHSGPSRKYVYSLP